MAKEGEGLRFDAGQSVAALLIHGGMDEVTHGAGASRIDDMQPGRGSSHAELADFDLQLTFVERQLVF